MDHNKRAAGHKHTLILCLALVVGLMAVPIFLPACNSKTKSTRRTLPQIRPANNTALLLRNASYLKKIGRVELAVEDLEDAHAQEPENLEILDALIQCYEELRDFDRAQELYEEALSRSGQHPALENNRCYSLYLQGRLGQAEACFRKVLARQPDNQAARNNLGLVLCQQGRTAEALAMWREALSDGEARQRLGQALASLGKEPPPNPAAAAPAPAPQQVAAAVDTAAPSVSSGPGSSPATPASPPAAAPAPRLRGPAPTLAASADTTPSSGEATSRELAESPRPAAATAQPDETRPPVLSVSDLTETRIELKNGNGFHGDARVARRQLALEGFNVVAIGNHIDFGLDETIITYRPESVRVAKALAAKHFPGAKLQENGKLSPEVDIRIALGRDRLDNLNIACLHEDMKISHHAEPPSAAETAVRATQEKVAVRKAPNQPVAPLAGLSDSPAVQDISQARIEIKNGNGVRGQAREIRQRLAAEGFTVASIGNHVDFGLQKTIIAYRPESARVAQALYKKFFPEAILQEEAALPTWTDVRVSLGRDLISAHSHLAQCSPGKAPP